MARLSLTSLLLLTLCFSLTSTSCITEDDLRANVMITEGFTGDIAGDVTGNGGNTSESFTWQNNLETANYNADITAQSGGLFQMIIEDAEGKILLNRSLDGAQEPDSFSGVTSRGTPGNWTLTIVLSKFSGDGSFSLSEGD